LPYAAIEPTPPNAQPRPQTPPASPPPATSPKPTLADFARGDKVSFTDRHLQTQVGVITRSNPKTATVDTGEASWTRALRRPQARARHLTIPTTLPSSDEKDRTSIALAQYQLALQPPRSTTARRWTSSCPPARCTRRPGSPTTGSCEAPGSAQAIEVRLIKRRALARGNLRSPLIAGQSCF